MNDFPAAHSMDTEWFAIDRDGHVALFNSEESGAVPVDLWESEPALGFLARARHRTKPVFLIDGFRLPFPFIEPEHWVCTGRGPYEHVLLFLRTLDWGLQQRAREKALVFRAGTGHAVLFHELGEARAREIHDAGACLGCYFALRPGASTRAAARGAFVYTHLAGENWISAPYGRCVRPEVPVRLELPSEAERRRLNLARFPGLCFEDHATLQPAEWTRCIVDGGDAYLASDGRTIRANPGGEAAFRERFSADAWVDPRFVLEWPPSSL